MSNAQPRVHTATWPVRFAHCDPAGIIFYPRYIEMLNWLMEDWFAELGVPFEVLTRQHRASIPTVNITADFLAVSRLSDPLDFALRVEKLGGSSCTLWVQAHCRGELRMDARATIVYVDLDAMKARRWPDDLRAGLATYLIAQGPRA